MCRVLLYMGKHKSSMHDLLYGTDNSLAHQSYAPQLMKYIQNLAGLGFCAWSKSSEDPEAPFYYKTTSLPFFDKNLYRLSKKIKTHCLLAHVRGVEYSIEETVSEENVHPFKLENTNIVLAHNGSLAEMPTMKMLLTPLIKPEVYAQIHGTTDSEWIYALFLSQLKDHTRKNISLNEASDAIIKTLEIIRRVRDGANIHEASPVNLFITNGNFLIVTRFVFDFGCNISEVSHAFLEYHSLWATFGEYYGAKNGVYNMQGHGKRESVLFASEPLTHDRTNWIELPEYSITKAWHDKDEILFRTETLYI